MTDAEGDDRRATRGHALRTLRHRNFRLIYLGQLVSAVGGQMQSVALAWHLFVLTNSTFKVGLFGFFSVIPFMVLSFVGGATADRFDRRRVMIVTQTILMGLSLVLVAATLTHQVTSTLIYAIAVASGMARAFDGPARQAMIPNLVQREEIGAALTLNTMLRQMATIVGPGLGGLFLGLAGLAPTYFLNSLSFLAIIGALVIMDPVQVPARQRGSNWQLALGGLRFVRGEPVVLSILCLDFLVNLLGSLRALMPVFARDILQVGPEGLGFLYAAPAAGAVVGALFLGAMGGRFRHPAIMLLVSGAFGAFTMGFGVSTIFPLSLFCLFGTGLMDVIGEVLRSTIVQLRTPDELRGRVTALTVIFTNGGPQLGQLQSGALASALGPMEAAVIGGFAVSLSALAFTFNPYMRRRIPEDVARTDAAVAAAASV